MSDDFIGSLKADWDRSGAEAEVVRLRRRRWTSHALLAGDMLGAVSMAACGAFFAVLALRYRDLLFTLSALTMLPVGVPLVIAKVWMRLRGLAWEGETSEGVLRSSLRRLAVNRRVLKLGRSAAVILFALALVVWAFALAGLLREPKSILAVITASWVVAGALALGWVRWRLARVGREIAACEALLKQFEDSAGDA